MGLHEDEEVDEEPVHVGPPLILLHQQQLGHEGPVRDELEPREGEPRAGRGLQRVERRRKRRENLKTQTTAED